MNKENKTEKKDIENFTTEDLEREQEKESVDNKEEEQEKESVDNKKVEEQEKEPIDKKEEEQESEFVDDKNVEEKQELVENRKIDGEEANNIEKNRRVIGSSLLNEKKDNLGDTREVNVKNRRVIGASSEKKSSGYAANIEYNDNVVDEIEKQVNNLIEKEIENIREQSDFSSNKEFSDDYDLSELRNNILKYSEDVEYAVNIDEGENIDTATNSDVTNDNNNSIDKQKVNNSDGKKRKTYNSAMSKVLVAVTVVFMGLIAYIIYFVSIESQTKLNNEYNERSLLLEETIIRGSIFSDDGKILAETVKQGEKWKRYYPYGKLFVHAVGRYDKGKTGIELSNDMTLVSTSGSQIDRIIDDINNEKSAGNSIVTSLNYKLQKVASDALGNRKGAVVAIEPNTGKILAMVSKPDYDPNYIAKNWSVMSNADNSNKSLINRATQGLYPPGSIFKIVTALGYMRNNSYSDFSYRCTGTTRFNGYKMQCYNQKVHGNENLESAFANSCNLAFGYIGTQLKSKKMNALCKSLMFNEELPYDGTSKKSSFNLNNNSDDTMLAQTAIGQGNTQITPLHAAILAGTIANKGNVMKAYMVDRVIDEKKNVISVNTPKKVATVMTDRESNELTKMMVQVTKKGTATELGRLEYDVAGKTGSAEYDEQNNSHAWFVGFAPASEPTIAISVIVEGAGKGSTYAVPIARKVFEEYMKQ